jgi:hypothetical protein
MARLELDFIAAATACSRSDRMRCSVVSQSPAMRAPHTSTISRVSGTSMRACHGKAAERAPSGTSPTGWSGVIAWLSGHHGRKSFQNV